MSIEFSKWFSRDEWSVLLKEVGKSGGLYLFGKFDTKPEGTANPLDSGVVYIGKSSRNLVSRWRPFYRGLENPQLVSEKPSRYPRAERFLSLFGKGVIPFVAFLKERDIGLYGYFSLLSLENDLVSSYRSKWNREPLIQTGIATLRQTGNLITTSKPATICLLSGGIDSTACFLKLLRDGHDIQPIFVDYGQTQASREKFTVEKCLDYTKYQLNLPARNLQVVKVDMGLLVKDGSRYLMFIGIASLYSSQFGYKYKEIALGVLDEPIYTMGANSKELLSVLNGTVTSILENSPVSVSFPLLGYTKETLGSIFLEFKFPVRELTWSCYWETPCGYKSPKDTYRCPACRNREVIFKSMGLETNGCLHVI